MHRAQLAASAFGDFFAVIGRLRTIKGALRDQTEDLPGTSWAAEFVRAIDDLHAARGRLVAIARPEIVEKLAALEHLEGDKGSKVGLTASTPEGQRVLTEVLVLLREDLHVSSEVKFTDLQTVLFSP